MIKISDALALIAIVLWVGGMWAIGYVAAPGLFSSLSDKAMAGMLAGKIFKLFFYVGLACAVYLILYRLSRFGLSAFKQLFFWLVISMLILALVGHYFVEPVLASLKNQALPLEVMQSVFKDRFARWHGVANILFLIQSVLGLVLIGQLKLSR